MDHSQPARPTLAVVVPAYNEAAVLAQFHARLAAVFDALDAEGSVLYVDDGSCDATWQVICNLAERDPRVAASALACDIARSVAALEPEIEALAGQLRSQRMPQVNRLRTAVRRGFALAAGVGAFAVLFALMPRPGHAPGAPAAPVQEQDSVIMSMSFEPVDEGRATAAPKAGIFNGNFDS